MHSCSTSGPPGSTNRPPRRSGCTSQAPVGPGHGGVADHSQPQLVRELVRHEAQVAPGHATRIPALPTVALIAGSRQQS